MEGEEATVSDVENADKSNGQIENDDTAAIVEKFVIHAVNCTNEDPRFVQLRLANDEFHPIGLWRLFVKFNGDIVAVNRICEDGMVPNSQDNLVLDCNCN